MSVPSQTVVDRLGIPRTDFDIAFRLIRSGVEPEDFADDLATDPADLKWAVETIAPLPSVSERLAIAWNEVTRDPAPPPYSVDWGIARVVEQAVFEPIIRDVLDQTNLESYLGAVMAPRTPDRIFASLYGMSPRRYARSIAAYFVEESRAAHDTPGDLAERATGRIYTALPRGAFALNDEHVKVLGWLVQRSSTVDQAKIMLKHDLDWLLAGPTVHEYRPVHLKERSGLHR